MIKLTNVSKRFQKNLCLNNINVEFFKNDKISLMGANGAGKTTLIRVVMGYYQVQSGKVEIRGKDIFSNRTEILKRISFIPQLPPPIRLSVKELINLSVKSTGVLEKDIINFSKRMHLDISECENKSFFKLSGGMKQKLLISIAMARKSDICIFDEATANLDVKGREIFYEMIEDKKDTLMLFITHRFDEIEKLVNRKIYMDLGEIVSDEII